jgi:hypothetical protein
VALAQHGGGTLEHPLLLRAALQLPVAQGAEAGDQQRGARPQRQQAQVHHARTAPADNTGLANRTGCRAMQKLLIIAVLVVIVWNLGAGLYYMIVDKGTTDRTVRALSWRIGISVALILLVCAGIYTGWIKPHGIYH